MRTLFTIAALLTCTATVSAEESKLDAYLARWEKTMAGVTTFTTVISRVDTDRVFNTETKYTGWVAYTKAGVGAAARTKAIFELKPQGKEAISEKVVCTGTHVYHYIATKKEIHEHELPRDRGGNVVYKFSLKILWKTVTIEVPPPPLSWMNPAAMKERYGLKLAKEDDNYVYVDVTPKNAEDTTEVQRARLVLGRKTFLPRQVWLEQPNGNEVLWDLRRSASGVKLDERYFDKPKAEAGWKLVPAGMAISGAEEKPRP